MPSLARRAVAEVYGTFALVFFGCGAIIMESFPTAHYGLMGIALAHAIVFSVAITTTMAISGGHLNPAITLGLWSTRRLPAQDAFVYVASQLAGRDHHGWRHAHQTRRSWRSRVCWSRRVLLCRV
jgi:glycerol uptake facilitator-like aquaporin